MAEFTRFVGLDVHKDTIAIAVAQDDRSEPAVLGTIPHDVPRLLRRLQRLGPGVLVAYEAGPTGYGLCRALLAAGISCQVIAPSKTPRASGDRVKTDRRDAVSLARFLRSGDLTAVHVPDEATEALRDLVRARDDAKRAEKTAKHHLSKFLLRHGRRYDRPTAWSDLHFKWLEQQRFEQPAQQRVLDDYLHAVLEASARVERLTQQIQELIPSTPVYPLAIALQSLRGIKLVAGATIACELGDLRRFSHPRQLMSFLGLVPSEHSSGQSIQRGRITKTGNSHVRRVLVEAAWSYRFPPRANHELGQRLAAVSGAVRTIAWKAQHRLHKRYWALTAARKSPQRLVVAVARELVGFVWAIGQQPQLLAH